MGWGWLSHGGSGGHRADVGEAVVGANCGNWMIVVTTELTLLMGKTRDACDDERERNL